jgi:predicted GNAT family acetyltransferase
MELDNIPLINSREYHKFEMTVDGEHAFIDYLKHGDVYYLIHTEVPETLQGKGVAGALVEKTFKYLEENHLKMRPFCQYVQFYLKRHPEWNRLIEAN